MKTRGTDFGYDAGKKVKGRERHILTDPQDLLVKVKVHPAGIQDRNGAGLLISAARMRAPGFLLYLRMADMAVNKRRTLEVCLGSATA